MKFSFRKTIIAICIIMGILFLYNLSWLKGLYQTSLAQVEKDIHESLAIADQNELFFRLDKLKKLTDSIASNTEINVEEILKTKEDTSTGEKIFYAKRDSNYISISSNSNYPQSYDLFKENSRTMEKLATYMQKGIHNAIDSIIPTNIKDLDSILHIELNRHDIHRDFVLQRIQLSNDSVCFSFPPKAQTKHFNYYDYPYDIDNQYAYRLYIKASKHQVMIQMAGILSTSIIIFILIIFTYIYLLKTIHKLQTEEELKTNFTNNMTHELKTPIAVSYAAVDALLVSNKPVSTERQTKYLNIAKKQMNHLSGLVEQILSMSRKNNNRIELALEKVDLKKIVSGLTEKLTLIANKKIVVKTDFKHPTIVADKLHITNILNNLIENSIKYSGEPVYLTITSKQEGNAIAISVKDNGIGISSKYQKKLFDKFYRVPTGNIHDVKGFGLGLFYVKAMTEKHGGTVEVKSSPGKGSIFTFKIPQQWRR